MSRAFVDEKTVLILAYFFPPRDASGAARPFRFYKYLPRFGYPTKVICEGLTGPTTPGVYPAPGEQRPSSTASGAAKVLEIMQRLLFSNSFRLPWLPHAMAAAHRVMSTGSVSAVFSTFPPVSTHFAGLLLKRRYGVKWIADFRDPIVGNPGLKSKIPVFNFLERVILKNADVVISNTEAAADILRKRYPREGRKVQVIWNGFDPEDRLEPAPLPQRARRIMIHPGDIYSFRHPGRLLLSMHRLMFGGLLSGDDLGIALQGDIDKPWRGIDDSALALLLEKDWVELRNHRIPTEQARRQTAEADYLLLLDVTGPASGYQVPAKLFDYISIGRPILVMTTPNSSVDWILSRCGVPYTCVYEDDSNEQVDKKVLSFFRLPTEPVKPGPWFDQMFNGEGQAKMLAGLLDSR